MLLIEPPIHNRYTLTSFVIFCYREGILFQKPTRTNSPWGYFGNGLGYGTHSTSLFSMRPHDTELVLYYYPFFFIVLRQCAHQIDIAFTLPNFCDCAVCTHQLNFESVNQCWSTVRVWACHEGLK